MDCKAISVTLCAFRLLKESRRLSLSPAESTSLAAKSSSRFTEIYEQLRAEILSCRLRPGAKLQINQLARELDVSLSGVREALSKLSAEGLVICEPQRGFHVAPVSLADLADLTMTRIDIESLCLARSIELGGVEWETAVVAAMHRLSRTPYWAQDGGRRLSDEWANAHHTFHEALVSAADSAWRLRIRHQLYQQSERYRRLSVPVLPETRDVQVEHQEICTAALKRDTSRACELMREHLLLTMRIIVAGLRLE
jgi:DNA-binding GntR family transcriptional regulator